MAITTVTSRTSPELKEWLSIRKTLSQLKWFKKLKLSGKRYALLMLYMLALVLVTIIVHEAAHILTAMAFGARFGELRLGFIGINPSVTLPEWFTGIRQTVVHYSGGDLGCQ